MNCEELFDKISGIEDRFTALERPLPNRIYMTCEAENVYELNRFLFEDLGLRFVIASGCDPGGYFEVIYHYAYDPEGCLVNLRVLVRNRENPVLDSIAPLLPAASWIEREINDLLGIDFRNHPDMRRLILADDWPEGVYPLRKDTKVAGGGVEK